MTPQLTKIAECLSESHAREIKLARCLAESLKRIQTLESSAKTKDTKAKATELRFNAAVRDLAEQLAKQSAENEELIRKMEEAIKVEFPAQLAALKAEFATPAAQAAAPQSFNPRGDYEAGAKYTPFDYVSSNGSSYIALVENPTQPPSKKSKQWMLVAARGAGGGGVTGLGTAAYRDVGQAQGNVLELSAAGQVQIGGSGVSGNLGLWDDVNQSNISLQAGDAELFINSYCLRFNSNFLASFNNSTLTSDRTLDIPDASGTIALLSQVGDRYLTSSTTSNTIGNGAKTFTVGTGLAYTPTQDITIVFNASNHMHASVTSYNSATGALVVDVNYHTGSGTYAVWTVNVGGIGAGAIPSGGTTGQVLAKVSANNYDDAWVTPTVAVDGVTGLGTGVATALAVNLGAAGSLATLSDLSGASLGSIGTQVTGSQVSAFSNFQLGINSTLLYGSVNSGVEATMPTASGTLALTSQLPIFGTGVATALAVNAGSAGAFVRTTDTATTTTAGVVAGIGTSDTAITNALTVADYLLVPPAIMAWERTATAVTGSGTFEGNSGIYFGVGTGVTASSTSRVDSNTSSGDPWYFGNYNTGAFGATDRYIINGVFLRISSTSTGVWRFGIGKTHGGAVGQWTEAGFGFACKNNRLWSFTHNGTTYIENDTGVDIPSGEIPMQFCILRNSTAHLFYLNRVLVATHTATGYANGRFIRIEAGNGANSAAQRMRIAPVTLRFL